MWNNDKAKYLSLLINENHNFTEYEITTIIQSTELEDWKITSYKRLQRLLYFFKCIDADVAFYCQNLDIIAT